MDKHTFKVRNDKLLRFRVCKDEGKGIKVDDNHILAVEVLAENNLHQGIGLINDSFTIKVTRLYKSIDNYYYYKHRNEKKFLSMISDTIVDKEIKKFRKLIKKNKK